MPVFLPGKSHGQRSLAGHAVHGITRESDMTEEPDHHISLGDLASSFSSLQCVVAEISIQVLMFNLPATVVFYWISHILTL